jgi:teichuronic acid biosynthesis glycosyltransferase TuaG
VENYTYKKNIRLVQSTEKLYTPGARNKGIELAKGKYIAFLDADDFWHKDKLKEQILFLERNNDVILSFTGVKKINGAGKQLGELIIPKKITYTELLRGNKICCSSVIINQELLGYFKFNEDIKIVEDYALWLKILRESGSSAFGINEPLTYYRVHNEAKTNNKLVSAFDTWKVLRKSENLSILQSIIPFFFYAKDGLRKLLIR